MRHNPQIMCFGVALLCVLGIGCAKNTTERPRTLQSRVADIERTHHEQAQRLTALEDRVSALQNRTYEVTTTNGQKTRYAVRIVEPVPAPLAPPVTPVTPLVTPVMVSGITPAQQPAHSQGPTPKIIDPATSPAPLLGSTQPHNIPQATPRPAPIQHPVQTPARTVPQSATSLMLPPEAAPAPNFAPVTTPVIADAKLPPSKLPPSAKGEEAAYTVALNLIRAGQYAQGRAKFEEFLQSYPAGRYAANAYYWMGESFYAQHQYAEALAQFNQAAARFPKHHKTADALLKAGMASQKIGDTEGATRYFRTLLTDFPQSEAAQTARNKGWGR